MIRLIYLVLYSIRERKRLERMARRAGIDPRTDEEFNAINA